MQRKPYDAVIVGSGAGGSTLARELAIRGKRVAIVEAGGTPKELGNFRQSMHWFDRSSIVNRPLRSREGVIIWRVFVDGGSTLVACGNGVRCLEKELAACGVSLETEYGEVERELAIAPLGEDFLSDGTRRIRSAAAEIGVHMELMPKFISATTCCRCGLCTYGCRYGAKWTANRYLDDATDNGTDVIRNSRVSRVLIDDGTARGVAADGPGGAFEILADTVIVSAGGLGTPVILQHSGIGTAGKRLFLDLFVTTYGAIPGFAPAPEPPMLLVNTQFHADQGFILSPFINQSRLVRLVESGPKGIFPHKCDLVGLMTKIRDEEIGQVFPDGSISKGVTGKDWEKLGNGIALSKQILARLGAREKDIFVSRVQGAHPGGTAAIGEVVDPNLETGIKNLFVCDASVLPRSPGLPPILVLLALAKRLGKHLSR